MNTAHLAERAAQLFNNPLIEASLNEYNQQKWVEAMEWLGDKHIIAKANQVERKAN